MAAQVDTTMFGKRNWAQFLANYGEW